ncbi:AbaSI family restriction endonuclease [Oceanospirillum sanctuarii]|uniref:AbaSI family restriction endonuclease n=1 Tax=Oceanospirillum sanctuarii TaxID=1434821 RepID=UPI001123F4FB|nr:hypothetical protein [Oceanospirillum sanctuarii]
MDWKYEYLIEQIHRTLYKKHENYIISSLLHDKELSDLMPCTQFYVDRSDGGYALIDLFYPQINLAIEIDEPAHLSNSQSDAIRQQRIEDKLDCEFFRVKVYSGGVDAQIESLKEKIKLLRASAKTKGIWEEWKEPARLSLNDAKAKLSNTLFLKIKGKIPPEDLLARQTGYWRICKRKQSRIESIVIVHDSVVTKVFGDIRWHTSPENIEKFGYKGKEINSQIETGTIIEDWGFQQTVTYSADMY